MDLPYNCVSNTCGGISRTNPSRRQTRVLHVKINRGSITTPGVKLFVILFKIRHTMRIYHPTLIDQFINPDLKGIDVEPSYYPF